ncbi:hypothetical protein ACTGVV_12500, partial [Streptococcus suis]
PAAWTNDGKYTSRRYLVGSAFGAVAAVTGNSTLATTATTYIKDGLGKQWSNGVNPENGVADINIQALGVLYASHYYQACSDSTLRSQVAGMI